MRELPLLIIFTSTKQLLPMIERHAHRLVFGSFVLSATMIAGFVAYWVVFHLILRKSVSPTNHLTLRRFRKPTFWLLVVSGTMLAVPAFGLSNYAEDVTEHVLHILFILCLAWMMICGVYAVQDILMRRYDISLADNLRARQVRTQMAVMRRVAIGFVGLLALGLILYTFNHTRLWQAGAGLLASADWPLSPLRQRRKQLFPTFWPAYRSPSRSRFALMTW